MNGNIGVASSREKCSVSGVVHESVPVVVHVDPKPIPESNDIAVGREFKLDGELYELRFAQGAEGSRIRWSVDWLLLRRC